MPSLPSVFRRKPTEPAADPIAAPATEDPTAAEPAEPKPRGYTPAKGRQTPKRTSDNRRRVVATTPMSKEERREKRRIQAAEFRTEGGPRDRGEERQLVRNIIDSRRTVGSYFLPVTLLIFIGQTGAMPPAVRLAASLLWPALALAMAVDSFLIARTIKRLVKQRFPNTRERMGSLYYYGIMRGLSFRRIRMPVPAVRPGDPI